MRVLITRPLPDARRTAAVLHDRGLQTVIEPLFAINPFAATTVDLTGVQGFLLTSANGVRALVAALPPEAPQARQLQVYAVGDATGQVARESGFTRVETAGGDVSSLAALVKARARPDGGTFIHAAGTEVAGDLGGELAQAGFSVRRERLYDTRPAVALSRETRDLLATGGIHAALFYSPRTAAIFADLAQRADLADACRGVHAYCLSQAVARELAAVPFGAVRIAAEPSQESLLALLDADRADGVFANAEGGADMTDRPDQDAKDTGDSSTPAATAAAAAAAAGSGPGRPGGSVPGGGTVPPGSSSSPSSPSSPDTPPSSPAADTRSDPASRRSGSGKAVVAGIAVVAVVGLLGVLSLPWWHDRAPEPLRTWLPSPPQQSAAVADLRQQNERLQADLASLRQRLEAVTAQVGDLEARGSDTAGAAVPDDLDQRLDAMQDQLQQLSGLDPQRLQEVAAASEQAQQRMQQLSDDMTTLRRGTADAATVLAMQERLQEVASLARQTASRHDTALGLLLTTAQLRQAVDQGNPFSTELRTVRAIAASMPGVSIDAPILTDFADAGIPTRDMLAERYDRLGTEIIRAAAAPDDAPEWVQDTVRRLMGLVTIRRVDGEAVGDEAPAIVARAGSAVQAGDLRTAVDELKKLQGDAAVAADDWLIGAEARLAADKALGDLTSEALARFAAAERAGEAPARPAAEAPATDQAAPGDNAEADSAPATGTGG
ncbi:uroporphyrinogen-III synthase [Caenispirillum bisanense]|uniref:uroporphyrinogen-III synthase n=1 Tax=Caenispirillum bisanense TaxID=414052 RepID=UPI0031D68A8E